MHPENSWYGANQVLAVYAFRRAAWTPPSLPGRIAHDRLPAAQLMPVPGLNLYLWNTAQRAGLDADARRRTAVIGSPWVYLQELYERHLVPPELNRELPPGERIEVLPQPADVHTLVLPEHGIQGALAAERVVAAVRERGAESVRVLLADRDWHTPIRTAYENAGLETFTAGSIEPAPGTSALRVLPTLLAHFRAAQEVLVTGPSTFGLYAASKELPVHSLGITEPGAGDDPVVWNDPAALIELARTELGFSHQLTPLELQIVLEWNRRG